MTYTVSGGALNCTQTKPNHTGYSILLFMNPLNFVAVILKVLLVNLLAALNFANVF